MHRRVDIQYIFTHAFSCNERHINIHLYLSPFQRKVNWKIHTHAHTHALKKKQFGEEKYIGERKISSDSLSDEYNGKGRPLHFVAWCSPGPGPSERE